jgi:hypothetical protein
MSYESYNYGGIDQYFGGFSGDKSDYEPPPGPPPSGMSIEQIRMRPVPKNPSLYQQDPKCSKGSITAIVPCEGADCDPGEMEPDCIDDPIYAKMMQQSPSGDSSFAPMSDEELEMFKTGKVRPKGKALAKGAPKRVARRRVAPSKRMPAGAAPPVEDVGSALDNLRAMIEAKRSRLSGYNNRSPWPQLGSTPWRNPWS